MDFQCLAGAVEECRGTVLPESSGAVQDVCTGWQPVGLLVWVGGGGDSGPPPVGGQAQAIALL